MIPKVMALKVSYEQKAVKGKSCLIVLQETAETKYTIHNVFRGEEADRLVRKLVDGGDHENQFT